MTLIHLSNRAVVALSGEPACDFLQGLVTSDMAALKPDGIAYSALLTPQGKILFDFMLFSHKGGYLIDCAGEHADDLVRRLIFYRLRTKVDIERRDDLAVFASPDATPPEIAGALAGRDPRTPELGARIIAPLEAGKSVCDTPFEDYEARRIGLGIAGSAADIGSGRTFPHEANLDQTGAVSFDKGCYVGQEVVSRMQHRGTARARIVPVLSKEKPLRTGSDVLIGARQAGRVLSAAGTKGLGLVRLDRVQKGYDAGEVLSVDGAPVTLCKPAFARYEFPSPDKT